MAFENVLRDHTAKHFESSPINLFCNIPKITEVTAIANGGRRLDATTTVFDARGLQVTQVFVARGLQLTLVGIKDCPNICQIEFQNVLREHTANHYADSLSLNLLSNTPIILSLIHI